jgi:hypothetical protein
MMKAKTKVSEEEFSELREIGKLGEIYSGVIGINSSPQRARKNALQQQKRHD